MRRLRGRRLVRAGIVTGVSAGALLAAGRLLSKWLAARARRRERAAVSATEGLWPPVPSANAERARVRALRADGTNDGSTVND